MCSRGQGIRETVRFLLTLLADCNCPHIPSESFRLAKFNKPEVRQLGNKALCRKTPGQAELSKPL